MDAIIDWTLLKADWNGDSMIMAQDYSWDYFFIVPIKPMSSYQLAASHEDAVLRSCYEGAAQPR